MKNFVILAALVVVELGGLAVAATSGPSNTSMESPLKNHIERSPRNTAPQMPATEQVPFSPHLLRVEISNTNVAPGESFQVTTVWRTVGSQPAIDPMVVGVCFWRVGSGFRGGSWINGGEAFTTGCYPSVPATRWETGHIYTAGPMTLTVPLDAPEGTYKASVVMIDCAGQISLGSLMKGHRSGAIPPLLGYEVGDVRVSKKQTGKKPATWEFAEAPVNGAVATPPPAAPDVARSANSQPTWAADLVQFGDSDLGLALDKSRNYALASVTVSGTVFESSGNFPALAMYDRNGARLEFFPNDPRWRVTARPVRKGMDVRYAYRGFEVVVRYRIDRGAITISVRPVKETDYKALLVSGGGAFFSIPAVKDQAAATAFVLAPATGGRLVSFPRTPQCNLANYQQSWLYPATFVALGYNGRGLILRCPQYGATWSFGSEYVQGKFSLVGDCAEPFRPGGYDFAMPLVEPHIDFQIVPIPGDVNGDKVFNWVDIGVTYREKFIHRTRNLDQGLRDAVVGKIDIAGPPGFQSAETYDQLIREIPTIDFAPQVWWLVGAHTAPGHRFEDPPYSLKPDPSHDGPGGYDYFHFKRDAAAVGARIGIHEYFQDMSEKLPDWKHVPVALDASDGPQCVWGGTYGDGAHWQNYPKAINVMLQKKKLLHTIDEHLRKWDVRPGDTWHWDCFTAQGGNPDYSRDHPATVGANFRDRIAILKHIKSLGVCMTSEGLQEGVSEYCDFAWVSQVVGLSQNNIPLLPVLFQGKAYYGLSSYAGPPCQAPSYGLLLGGKPIFESAHLDRDAIIPSYFGHNTFWSLIANRTVKNITQTKAGWRVDYTQGGSLTVDLTNKVTTVFALEIDGKKYTPDTPPESPWGIAATKTRGEYRLTYPAYSRAPTSAKRTGDPEVPTANPTPSSSK